MVKITTVQAAHTYGVLDPFMAERRDTKFVPGSLSAGENIVILPQGGYTDRGGTDDCGRVRRHITERSDYAVQFPNGLATGGAAGSRFILAELSFAQPALLIFLDIKDIFTLGAAVSGALVAEWLDGSTWRPFGFPLKIETETYRGTRRLASGAPGHDGHSSTRFRICIDGSKAPAAIRFTGVAAWTERAEKSQGAIRSLRSSSGDAYQAVVTDNNIDIFQAGIWQASLHLPLWSAETKNLKVEASYDSALFWHTSMEPQKAIRLGASTEWSIGPIAFEDMPLVDYGAAYTNGVDEMQAIRLIDVTEFDLAFEGEISAAMINNPNDIKAKLEALPNIGPGLGVTGTNTTFDVVFSSPKTRARDVPLMIGTHFEKDGLVSIRTTRRGKKGGEAIISPTRGWPAVGRFAMGRLNMFGLRSRSATQLSSVTGQPFSLNAEVDVATAALVYDIADSEGSKIVDALFGRVLVMFATDAVYYFGNRTLDATKTPEIVRSAAPGIAAGVPPVETDNAILYIEDGGSILRSLNYSELEQNYVADNASVLSAALVKNVIDMTRRAGANRIDADMVVMVNGDGTATALTTMRSQEVSGFAPWRTDGRFVATATDHDNVLWFLVERGTEVRFERFAPEKLLDEGITITPAVETNAVDGLRQFEGRSVWAIASGEIYGPHVVANGRITLDDAVSGPVRVGTWIPASATDQPVRLEEETRRRNPRLKRVVRAEISVVETSSLAIACNGSAPLEVSLFSNDEIVLDEAPLDRLLTGRAEAEGMHGFSPEGTLTVTQVRPGMLTVRSVTKDIVI